MSAPKISAEEFRKRYLVSLRQQIANDSKNYQANQLFKETAQPAVLEDNRSITEKVADEGRLGQILRSELGKITDMGSANEIVNRLSLPDKQFLLTQFGAFSSEASRRFKFGFTYDIFKDFFEKFQQSVIATGGLSATPEAIAESVIETQQTNKSKRAKADPEATGDFETQIEGIPFPIEEDFSNIPKEDWTKIRKAIVKELRRQLAQESFSQAQIDRRKDILKYIEGTTIPELKGKTHQQFIAYFDANPDKINELNLVLGGVSGEGIKGCGLKKSKTKVSGGIPEVKRFAKFGRYVIDRQKLKDGQCVIRFESGACIHKLPARRIGKEIQNVLTKIAGGALPSYEDINSLSQDDRRFMFNIQKMAKMDAQIPSPDKDTETKQMEEFEKMRGQILAGNDNKDLIKKFKLTLLMFAKDGRIPRREVNEVLMEMASIGL